MISLIFLSATTTIAQQQRRSIEDRVKEVIEKIKTPLDLKEGQIIKIDSVFTQYYENQQKLMGDRRSSGQRTDRSAFQKFNVERNEV